MTLHLAKEQRAVATFLASSAAHETDAAVEVIETHISVIFLVGERALKMKKAVRLPYLDYSTLEQRFECCKSELQTNTRTAPDVYHGVAAVRRDDSGRLALDGDGDGEVVEWLVDMRRFGADCRLDRLLEQAAPGRHLFVDLADHVARFHANAATARGPGGAAGVGLILENVAESLRGSLSVFPQSDLRTWEDKCRALFGQLNAALDERRATGAVRHCHGDMHLANICVIDGEPVLFDGIEFSAAYAWIDVIYDLAFALMDLGFRGHGRFASIMMNRYFDVTGDGAGQAQTFAVLPLFLSMRAAVRAHVSATQALLDDGMERNRLAEEARRYLAAACGYLDAPSPRLIAVGGLSGGGKSRMAREIAPYVGGVPGARVVRTDAVRKRIAGAGQEQRLGAAGYTPVMHERTYDAFHAEARTALLQGRSVVLDAVFPISAQRQRAAALARELSVPFHGLWIDAPEEVRVSRVTSRQRNISDVTEEIAREQSRYDLGEIEWTRIDSSGPREETLHQGQQAIAVI